MLNEFIANIAKSSIAVASSIIDDSLFSLVIAKYSMMKERVSVVMKIGSSIF